MKIPKSFELLGSTYSVTLVDDLIKWGAKGVCRVNEKSIVLQKPSSAYPVSGDDLRITFNHELVHAILDEMGELELCGNEKFVDLFAKMLHQYDKTAKFLKDNKKK